MIRILIADDHLVVRRGLRQMLEQEPGFEIIGEGANGHEILTMLENGIRADVLLCDVSMPDMDGLELAKATALQYPDLQIIMLTIQEEENYIQQAFQAGIKSYLFKTAHEEEVIFAIRQVARGLPYLCSGLSDKVIKKLTTSIDLPAVSVGDVQFSERELEVLRLIAAGFSNIETAEKLFTSKRTVEGHRQSMIDKTGSRNSLALIAFAIRHGLLN